MLLVWGMLSLMDDLLSLSLLNECELESYIIIMVWMRFISWFLTSSYVSIFNIIVHMQLRLVSHLLTPNSRSISWLISFYVISLLTFSCSTLFDSLVPFFCEICKNLFNVPLCSQVHLYRVFLDSNHWHTLGYEFIEL